MVQSWLVVLYRFISFLKHQCAEVRGQLVQTPHCDMGSIDLTKQVG